MKIYYGFQSKKYEDGGDEQKTEKNRGNFCGRPGHRRGSSTTDGWIMDFCTNLLYIQFLHKDMVIKIYEALFMH